MQPLKYPYLLQFEQQHVHKTYWAVVRGHLPEYGRINYPLKYQPDPIAESRTGATLQDAVTDYRCLAQTELPFQSALRYPTSRYSWVELTPQTGRKHQLRRHMKHIFHPIVGDTNYGDLRQNHAVTEHLGTNRLMLHARELSFESLESGETVHITAPTDEQWTVWLEEFDM